MPACNQFEILRSICLSIIVLTFVGQARAEPSVLDKEKAGRLNVEGLNHFRANRFDDALGQFEAAARADASEPEYPNNAGVCYLQTQRFAQAREKFRLAASLRELPLYRYNEGLAALQLGEYNPAAQLFSRAVQLDPAYGEAWKHLGIATFAMGDYGAAEAAWKSASELMRDPEVETNLGTVYLNQKRYDAARTQFEKAVALNSSYYLAHFNLGVLFQAQKKFPEAEKSYQRAAALEPRAYATFYNLAIVQTHTGQREAAIASLEKFLEVLPPALVQQATDARKRLAELRGARQ